MSLFTIHSLFDQFIRLKLFEQILKFLFITLLVLRLSLNNSEIFIRWTFWRWRLQRSDYFHRSGLLLLYEWLSKQTLFGMRYIWKAHGWLRWRHHRLHILFFNGFCFHLLCDDLLEWKITLLFWLNFFWNWRLNLIQLRLMNFLLQKCG